MPRETFFRLSAEKKSRITDAAGKEFFSKPYSRTSINQIIKDADIPRGSFYQYFEDKKDLFLYVIGEHIKSIISLFEIKLRQSNGDLFKCIDDYIDEFIDSTDKNMEAIKIVFSELWVFEMIWDETIINNSCRKNELTGKLVDDIDRELLDVENDEELYMLLGIIGATIRDILDKKFLSGDKADKDNLKRVFHGRILSLKKHYTA